MIRPKQWDGERVCPSCNGCGHDPKFGYQPMGGCDRCQGTGVVNDLRIGDREPMPKRKLDIRPSSNADDKASSPRGVFRNGRSK